MAGIHSRLLQARQLGVEVYVGQSGVRDDRQVVLGNPLVADEYDARPRPISYVETRTGLFPALPVTGRFRGF